ncbi:hypothetical protein SCACP_08210 [Sporomusa carbonis]|uniref:hypothetical protein n=1 Tax=Sporomusa carbonis TaxID=3076075 RepID=UPI003A6D4CD8
MMSREDIVTKDTVSKLFSDFQKRLVELDCKQKEELAHFIQAIVIGTEPSKVTRQESYLPITKETLV